MPRPRSYRRPIPPREEAAFDSVLGPRRGATGPEADVVRLRSGDRVELVLPFSEACIHLRVAGKCRTVELVARSPT